MRILVRILPACVASLIAGPAVAAQCVLMSLFDQNGGVVPTEKPVVGLVVGDNPIIEGALPVHYSRKPIGSAPCPAALVENTRTLFNESCTSEDRRKRAAGDNKAELSVINKGCADMAKALQGRKD